MSKLNDLKGVSNGFTLLLRAFLEKQSTGLNSCLANKNVRNDIDYFRLAIEDQLYKLIKTSPIENIKVIGKKTETMVKQVDILLKSDYFRKRMPIFKSDSRSLHMASYYYTSIRNYTNEAKKISLKELPKFQQRVSLEFFFCYFFFNFI